MAALLQKKAIGSPEDYARVVPVPPIDTDNAIALRVWRDMGYQLDYAALPWLIERYGVQDSEALVDRLLVIRDTRSTVE